MKSVAIFLAAVLVSIMVSNPAHSLSFFTMVPAEDPSGDQPGAGNGPTPMASGAILGCLGTLCPGQNETPIVLPIESGATAPTLTPLVMLPPVQPEIPSVPLGPALPALLAALGGLAFLGRRRV